MQMLFKLEELKLGKNEIELRFGTALRCEDVSVVSPCHLPNVTRNLMSSSHGVHSQEVGCGTHVPIARLSCSRSAMRMTVVLTAHEFSTRWGRRRAWSTTHVRRQRTQPTIQSTVCSQRNLFCAIDLEPIRPQFDPSPIPASVLSAYVEGSIPPELLQLQTLVHLALSSNDLTGGYFVGIVIPRALRHVFVAQTL